jgi:GNAT superfamily N-acetyltransferase
MADTAVQHAQPVFRAQPLTAGTWPHLEQLFGLPGGSIVRGCWCMFYRRAGKWDGGPGPHGPQNKQALCDLVSNGTTPGLIGYLGESPAGWISLGPREDYRKLQRSPIMKPVDSTPVWSVVCSYVARPYRGQGVQHRLLAAAISFARDSGATTLEAYPVDKAERSQDDFIFFGSRGLYEQAGFSEVARRSPTRVVMRLDVAPALGPATA